MKRLLLGALFAWATAACASAPPPPPPPHTEVFEPLPLGTTASCDLLPKLVELPFRPTGPILDPVYWLLRDQKDKVKDCLHDSITSTTPMPDPRRMVKADDFTVGDLAYMLLVDYYGIPLPELWPPDARADYEERGAVAYSTWIRKPGSRDYLQCRVRAWLESRGAESKAGLSPPYVIDRSESRAGPGPPVCRSRPGFRR